MRELNGIGDRNWQDYVSDQVNDMTSHLMTYPIQVRARQLIAFCCYVALKT